MNNKTLLRNYTKQLRKSLDITEISQHIIENIRKTKDYINAQNVMIFYPIKHEINLLTLLNDNKNFYLPRVNGSNIEVCPYKIGDNLVLSKYDINEPLTPPINKSMLDIVFIPALSIDKEGHRLGYGGGYYDRFLKDTNAKKIVVIPEELISDVVPAENHDIKCDGYITQKKASFLRG